MSATELVNKLSAANPSFSFRANKSGDAVEVLIDGNWSIYARLLIDGRWCGNFR